MLKSIYFTLSALIRKNSKNDLSALSQNFFLSISYPLKPLLSFYDAGGFRAASPKTPAS